MLEIILLILIALLVVPAMLWIYMFIQGNDFSVPSSTIGKIVQKHKKVMIIFPHADDETFGAGGLLSLMHEQGVEVGWLLLTKGERGNPTAVLQEDLKPVRVEEAQNVARIYGIDKLWQEDFPDNVVDQHAKKLRKVIADRIAEFKPSLVITFDSSGIYGHPDHMIVSSVVQSVVKKQFQKIDLWFVSLPRKVVAKMKLPEHMAKDNNFKKLRSRPSIKINIGWRGLMTKIKAVYCYQSQLASFNGKSMLRLPLWFKLSTRLYEYFHITK